MKATQQNKTGVLSRIRSGVIAFAIACMITAMLPMTAMGAITSPSGVTATGANNVTLHISATVATGAGSGNLVIEATDTLASNVPADENILASFHVYTTGDLKPEDISNIYLTFNVGTQYADAAADVYVEHNDGSTEILKGTVAADGSVTVFVDRLSYFSIAIDKNTVHASAASLASNKSATSPQTGVDTSVLAFATIACVAVGGCVAGTLYRRQGK